MTRQMKSNYFTTRSHKLVKVISYLLIFVVALRRTNDLQSWFPREYLLILMGVFTALFISEHIISNRITWYPWLYMLIQVLIVQQIGLFQEYQDTWSLLYVVLGFQAVVRFHRKQAVFWLTVFVLSIFITLALEFGLLSGLGRAMAWIVIGVFLISYDLQFAQHEDALEESEILLQEIKVAHVRLEEYSAQAIQLAAAEERNRMTQKIYDTVGQKIFAIQLSIETARSFAETDLKRLLTEINHLQDQTQTALTEMRQMISEWRSD